MGIGQALGALGAGIIFDVTDSYVAAFPMFTAVAGLAIAVLIFTRTPHRPSADPTAVAPFAPFADGEQAD